MDLLSLAAGAVAYFVFLGATKGLPATTAWARAKWNAGRAELQALQGMSAMRMT